MLRINCLEIDVQTSGPLFGARLEFMRGLNVICADNTKGKSTCVNSILYALGLEGMLGASHRVPLPAALTHEILSPDGSKYEVTDSTIQLEIENGLGEVVTIRRNAGGSQSQRQLVHVTFGAALSQDLEDDIETKVMHVRIPNSAQAQLGFHSFLAGFLGWSLPEVRKGGGTGPLYLECLAPFFFVDQLNGWDAVKSRMPTHFGIVDVALRAFEFILRMDILSDETERRQLESKLIALEAEWRAQRDEFKLELSGTGVVDRGIPSSVTDWNEDSGASLWTFENEEWQPVTETYEAAQQRLSELTTSTIPQVADISNELVTQLRIAEDDLAAVEDRFERTQRDVREIEYELVAVQKRLDTLDDNLRQYEDEHKIRKRHEGNPLDVSRGTCKTCRRPIKDALVDQNSTVNPMSLPANIAFLRDQRRMFEEMRAESGALLEIKKEERISLRTRLIEYSAEVQSLKRTLRQDAEAPAAAIVREQVILENRITQLRSSLATFEDPSARFKAIANEYVKTQNALKGLGARSLSTADESKLKFFDEIHKSQLKRYDFRSYNTDEVSIGWNSYQPVHDELPLGLVSASDMVRLVWAYLLGILHVAHDARFETNHPGLLIIDEPRQQNVKIENYDEFLSNAAEAAHHNQQIIVASSQLTDVESLSTRGATVNVFHDRILSQKS